VVKTDDEAKAVEAKRRAEENMANRQSDIGFARVLTV
jgi:F0F1-type ATP synthase epsilon subunit